MKKIFAILISSFFVISVFGVASVMGNGCNCDQPNIVVPKTVTVGQEFVFLYKAECGSRIFTDSGSPNVSEYIQYISDYPKSGYRGSKCKALKPGTIYFCDDQCSACAPSIYEFSCYTNCVTLTITPKNSFPMQQFMKFFGFGQKD
jgi:hypothetical protein